MHLSREKFSELCGGAFVPDLVSDAMIESALEVSPQAALDALAIPGSEWGTNSAVLMIESKVSHCRDRHVQAVLTVASKM